MMYKVLHRYWYSHSDLCLSEETLTPHLQEPKLDRYLMYKTRSANERGNYKARLQPIGSALPQSLVWFNPSIILEWNSCKACPPKDLPSAEHPKKPWSSSSTHPHWMAARVRVRPRPRPRHGERASGASPAYLLAVASTRAVMLASMRLCTLPPHSGCLACL